MVNVHTTCLKEIDLNNKQDKILASKLTIVKPQPAAQPAAASSQPKEEADVNMKVESHDQEAPVIGQKRTHIEYQQEDSSAFSGLQGIISGMESAKSKRQCTSSGGAMWSQSS